MESTEKTASDSELLKAVVVRVTYRSEETGFGVLKVEMDGQKTHVLGSPHGTHSSVPRSSSVPEVTIVGNIPPAVNSGMSIVARGQWTSHPKFGRQFKARSVTETKPTSEEAIIKYLGSGVVKGFGPVLAERVVSVFGEQTLDILDQSPSRLSEVPGIGAKKLEEVKESWQKLRDTREVLLFFQNHGISLSLAQRIYNAYGNRAIEKVKSNPYVLARDVWGIGFQTADTIARGLGIAEDAPERIVAGLCFAMKGAVDDGHCYLPRDKLLSKASKLLQVGDEELLLSCLAQALLQGELIKDSGANSGELVDSEGEDGARYYHPQLLQAEKELAGILAEMVAKDQPSISIADELVEELSSGRIMAAGQHAVLRLSPQQQEVVRQAAKKKLIVVTGGPGCGKTTVVRTVAKLFARAGLQTNLAAPTGRAAQRLSEVCEMPASTIHRLLKYDPMSRDFVHNRENKLELDALIVDECSMIDLPLACSLMCAVPDGARVVLVGDVDQLPSVGPGLILSDILSIEKIPRTRLTTLFRRADESSITHFAHQINQSQVPQIPEPDGSIKTDAYFLKAESIEAGASLVERLMVDQIPKKFGYAGSEITVLTPMNQGDLGTIALNQRLQERIVPAVSGVPRVKVGAMELRLGDRVVQRVNNYQLGENGVFNGDQGEIIAIDAEAKTVHVRLWDGREIEYPRDTLDQLDLAYAITIHRSQGSEIPAVVLVLHESHTILLERQLIYTAVTRAKRLLIVVGTRKALKRATTINRSKNRFTNLAQYTREQLGVEENLA